MILQREVDQHEYDQCDREDNHQAINTVLLSLIHQSLILRRVLLEVSTQILHKTAHHQVYSDQGHQLDEKDQNCHCISLVENLTSFQVMPLSETIDENAEHAHLHSQIDPVLHDGAQSCL